MQLIYKLLRQECISKYEHDKYNRLNNMQNEQIKCSLMSLIDCIDMHCWADLLYSKIVFFIKTIIFNDNHYLASAIYQLTLNISENSFIS